MAKIWPLFFAVLLQICQSVRASTVHSPIQLISQIFSGIQVWALAGPFQNFNLLLVRPDLDVDSDICCVSLFYWKIKFIIIACFLADAWRFCVKTEWYLELFIIPSTLIKASALTVIVHDVMHVVVWLPDQYCWFQFSFGEMFILGNVVILQLLMTVSYLSRIRSLWWFCKLFACHSYAVTCKSINVRKYLRDWLILYAVISPLMSVCTLTVCNHMIVVLLREHLCMVKLSSCMLYVFKYWTLFS